MISELGLDPIQVTGIPHFTESLNTTAHPDTRQQHTDGFSLNLSKQLLPKSF